LEPAVALSRRSQSEDVVVFQPEPALDWPDQFVQPTSHVIDPVACSANVIRRVKDVSDRSVVRRRRHTHTSSPQVDRIRDLQIWREMRKKSNGLESGKSVLSKRNKTTDDLPKSNGANCFGISAPTQLIRHDSAFHLVSRLVHLIVVLHRNSSNYTSIVNRIHRFSIDCHSSIDRSRSILSIQVYFNV
jgi:hypothetical protein